VEQRSRLKANEFGKRQYVIRITSWAAASQLPLLGRRLRVTPSRPTILENREEPRANREFSPTVIRPRKADGPTLQGHGDAKKAARAITQLANIPGHLARFSRKSQGQYRHFLGN
jgi:hypothetical protein